MALDKQWRIHDCISNTIWRLFLQIKTNTDWRAGAEPTCRFFAWTLLHKKILTANNLAKRNWTHDPIFKLCRVDSETLTHLCKDCTFSKQVWSYLKQWLDLAVLDWVGMNGSLHSYWRKCHAKFERRQRKRIDGIMIYFWWNVWKEGSRRTL